MEVYILEKQALSSKVDMSHMTVKKKELRYVLFTSHA